MYSRLEYKLKTSMRNVYFETKMIGCEFANINQILIFNRIRLVLLSPHTPSFNASEFDRFVVLCHDIMKNMKNKDHLIKLSNMNRLLFYFQLMTRLKFVQVKPVPKL
jgi:hypothetical protein